MASEGRIRTTDSTPDLSVCLLDGVTSRKDRPDVIYMIPDGAAMVQMAPPTPGLTFQEHVTEIISHLLQHYAGYVSRIDVVFDRNLYFYRQLEKYFT